jgi:outer membrane protein
MRSAVLIAVSIVMLMLPLAAHSQTLNIVYVDLQKVMLESEKGKDARKTLTSHADKLKKTLDGKQDEIQKMKDALEKQGATITPDARAEKERQYQAKVKDYQRVYNDYQGELQQKDMELTQKVLKEIEDVIRSLGDREKYSLILEKNQAGILFATPTIDITEKVIRLYNDASKSTPPPAPAKK